ncbi:MAG: terminase small subunit [Candidatus Hydrogenedentales bacterium]
MPKNSPLTLKQQRFVELYVELNNAAEAYRKAYNSTSLYAGQRAHQLLKLTKVAAYLTSLRAPALKKAEMTVERVLNELGKVAFTDLPGIIQWDGSVMTLESFEALTPEQRGCIQELSVTEDVFVDRAGNQTTTRKVRIKLHPKLQALQQIADHLGMNKPDPSKHAPVSINLHIERTPVEPARS